METLRQPEDLGEGRRRTRYDRGHFMEKSKTISNTTIGSGEEQCEFTPETWDNIGNRHEQNNVESRDKLPHSLDEADEHNEQEPLDSAVNSDQVPEKRKSLSPSERLWQKPPLELCWWNSDTKQYEYQPERFRWNEYTKRYEYIGQRPEGSDSQHPNGPNSLVLALPVDAPGPVVMEERVFQEIKSQEEERLSGLLNPNMMWQQREPHRTLDSFDQVPVSAVERQRSQEHRILDSFDQVPLTAEQRQRLEEDRILDSFDQVPLTAEQRQRLEEDRIFESFSAVPYSAEEMHRSQEHRVYESFEEVAQAIHLQEQRRKLKEEERWRSQNPNVWQQQEQNVPMLNFC